MVKTELLIIGSGPAGLCGAIAAASNGVKTLVIDDGIDAGGQLPKQTHKFFGHEDFYASERGYKIGEKLVDECKKVGVRIKQQTNIAGIYEDTVVAYDRENNTTERIETDYILIATGASEKFVNFENNMLPGIYGAGAVQTLMNQYGVLPGNNVLIVGSGNIGLIVAYQLIQAGARVKGIVEISDKIGGYAVHANKIKRLGVPIYLNYTIKAAIGDERVKGAVIVKVDKSFRPLPETERELVVDTICLAVGLTPSVELAAQAGAKIEYVGLLGGYVPVRDANMRTTVNNVFVAGDLSGVEEASTAMIEGEIAGYKIAEEIKGVNLDEKIISNCTNDFFIEKY